MSRRDHLSPFAAGDRPDLTATVLTAAAAVLVPAAGLVWATGQLAGLLFGQAWLHVGLTDLVHIVGQLPRCWHDPKLAWPASAQPELPGPVGMYLSAALVVAGVIAAARGLLRLRTRGRDRRRQRTTRHGARWAGWWELRRLLVRDPKPGRIVLGRKGWLRNLIGPLLAAEPTASVIILGAEGSGKTAGILTPASMEWRGPALITSIKHDVLRATAPARARRGVALVLDPLGLADLGELFPPELLARGHIHRAAWQADKAPASNGQRRSGQGRGRSGPGRRRRQVPLRGHIQPVTWSPLAACATWQGAQLTAEAIAATDDATGSRAGGLGKGADHEFWLRLGTKLLAPLLHAAAVDGRTMADVLRWVDLREGPRVDQDGNPYPDDEVTKILADLPDGAPLQAWKASQSHGDRYYDSLYVTVEDLLRIYADPKVQAMTSRNGLDWDWFLQGEHTLYLYAPAHEQRRLRPLFETVCAQLVQAAQVRAARSPDGMLNPRLGLFLDEAANVAALADLPELTTTARGQGIQLLTVWHDYAQLKARYGDRADTVLNGHRAKLLLPGLADLGTLKLGSELIGERAYTETTSSVSEDDGRRHLSQSTTSYRPLVPVDELRRLPRHQAILLYGNRRPTKIRLRPFYRADERWRRARLDRREARRERRWARWQAAWQRSGLIGRRPGGRLPGDLPAPVPAPVPAPAPAPAPVAPAATARLAQAEGGGRL